jgi:pyruvate/2-oxoglutarate dehydrogenase complex dihydrolipoamide acyltransferase (E2) component
MAFQGSLSELHLPDIVQLMSVSGKTGVFYLTDGPLTGEIYLRDGQIVHARIESEQGEDAVYALAIWNRGDFRFEPGVASEVRTISKSNTNLLMEAARRLDEWRVLSKKIPSVDLVPEFVVLEGREGQINLNTGEWLILSKIDGRRSVKAIAAAAGLSVFDAAKVLYGLVTTGLIRLRQPAERPSQPPASHPAQRPSQPPVPRTTPTPTQSAPAAKPAQAAPRAAPAAAAPAMQRLNRVRDTSIAFLGSVGESVVSKHYLKARSEIEQGAGDEAVEEAIAQIVRATSILRGPSSSESLHQQLKAIG